MWEDMGGGSQACVWQIINLRGVWNQACIPTLAPAAQHHCHVKLIVELAIFPPFVAQ